MSAGDQAAAAIITQLALAADGAVLGVTLAYVAARSFIKYAATSSALRRIKDAPSVEVSDLRSLLNEEGDDGGEGTERLVVVRGTVESKAVVCGGGWKNLFYGDLGSHDSNELAVVIQRSQKYIYNQWRGFLGWYPDIRTVLAKSWRDQGSTTMRTVPFVLVQDYKQPQSDYVLVDLDGSEHPLPLTTVHHQLQPIDPSPYTFLQAIFGHEYPVGVLNEDKILPIGTEVTAVGNCSLRNKIPEIKSCKYLPYFLSEKSKDQMMVELSFKSKVLLWAGILVGSVSISILGYAITRNWSKWKERREQRRAQQERQAAAGNGEIEIIDEEDEDEDGADNVPDGQLCVICLMRRRRSAFVPCGHLVCCQRCALSIERDLVPKCPVCRQVIHNSVRIYDS